jgi:hypothetical protein
VCLREITVESGWLRWYGNFRDQALAQKWRFYGKVEPCRLKTWPQNGDSTTNLNLGGFSPGPKKATRVDGKVEPCRLKTWPQNEWRFDSKVEPCRLKTWPQNGDSMTNLNLGGFSPGPKMATRVDDKPEPWWLLTWPQNGNASRRQPTNVEPCRLKTWPQNGESMTNLNLGGFSPGPKMASRRQT